MKPLRRLTRAIARWHHRAHIKDLDFVIRHHERMLLALPGEIRRVHELRRFHQGRLATLLESKSPVSWTIGRARKRESA
jgi:hypothetical protein